MRVSFDVVGLRVRGFFCGVVFVSFWFRSVRFSGCF